MIYSGLFFFPSESFIVLRQEKYYVIMYVNSLIINDGIFFLWLMLILALFHIINMLSKVYVLL